MVNEFHFRQNWPDDPVGPLKMEHFYFPLMLWCGGLLLSAIFLLVEIIKHRTTKVSMATQEEPGVSQSSAESEVEHNTDVEEIEDNKV